MAQLSFAQWIGSLIAGNAGAKVVKIANGYYDTGVVVRAAESVDQLVMTVRMEDRTFTPLETLMVEVLIDLAGFKGRAEAAEAYAVYLRQYSLGC
jgi:hypothetical protein